MSGIETKNKRKSFVRRKAFLVPAIIVAALIAYYTVMSMLAPSHKLAELREEFSSTQKEVNDRKENKSVDSKILRDSAYLSMIRERAFLQSRIIMAQTDSIYLTIDLADSTMDLEISGVRVHQARILHGELPILG